jgi:hypothetical protein
MVRKLFLGACSILASSCASTPPSTALPPPDEPDVLSSRRIGMEPGIDEPEATATWRSEDAVVYGVSMRSPSDSGDWLVKIAVHLPPDAAELADIIVASKEGQEPDPAASGPAPVLLRVEIFDAKGHRSTCGTCSYPPPTWSTVSIPAAGREGRGPRY